jgi:hypothetical protein
MRNRSLTSVSCPHGRRRFRGIAANGLTQRNAWLPLRSGRGRQSMACRCLGLRHSHQRLAPLGDQLAPRLLVEHRDLVARADIHRTPRHLQRPSGMLALVTGALSAAVAAAAGHRRFVSNRSLSTRIRKRFPVSRSGLHKNHPPKIIVFCRGENKNGACAYKTIDL